MKKSKKEEEYTVLIVDKINSLLGEEITVEELSEGDNMTCFMHALANLTPCYIYNNMVGEMGVLKFNHLANELCFKYLKLES